MKIGVLSDTHEDVRGIKKAVSAFNAADVSVVIHAGDIISPIMVKHLKELKMQFIAVFGNNDGEKNLWRKRLGEFKNGAHLHERYLDTELGGKKFLLIHEPDLLDSCVASARYDFIVYGHTHVVDLRKIGETVILNPGEVCGLVTGKSTAAIIDLEKGVTTVFLLDTMATVAELNAK